jgi:DNA-binding CsgD family transcriptional regulator
MILYNVASGFLPDPDIPISIRIQNGVAYFVSFCTSMYYVWYFYKAFDLKRLRFFATYGSLYFLFLPFLVLFAVPYYLTGNLVLSRQLAVVIPFLYGLAFIVATTLAFKFKFAQREYSDKLKLQLVVAAYIALITWVALPVIVFFGDFQVWQHIITNAGFLMLSIVYINTMIHQSRREYALLQAARSSPEILIQNCRVYGLTHREVEIVKLLSKGHPYKIIANSLKISENTVSKHISNVFHKTAVTNKIALIKKLHSQI